MKRMDRQATGTLSEPLFQRPQSTGLRPLSELLIRTAENVHRTVFGRYYRIVLRHFCIANHYSVRVVAS